MNNEKYSELIELINKQAKANGELIKVVNELANIVKSHDEKIKHLMNTK